MQQLLNLCQGLPEHSFGAGEVLLAEGEKTGRVLILIEGRIEILKGAVQVHVASEPGAMFGEISALLDIPHTATAKTLTPARLHIVDDPRAFLLSCHECAFLVAKLLAMRLHAATSYLADLKQQFSDHDDHFSMVDEVLESLTHQQDDDFSFGSDRYPDTKI